jgi:hypothetical protein
MFLKRWLVVPRTPTLSLWERVAVQPPGEGPRASVPTAVAMAAAVEIQPIRQTSFLFPCVALVSSGQALGQRAARPNHDLPPRSRS